MTAKPKIKWRKGWSRALSNESDRPVTLSRAPWDTCNRAATPEPQKETDGA